MSENTPTDSQQRAINHLNGPCLVLAGAGTGKTRVITERIAKLVTEHGVDPETIVALTFTEKAAGEMLERVDLLLPYGTFGVTTATFHGFCNELLRRHSFKVGIDPNAQLVAAAEQVSLLRTHFARLPLSRLKPPFNPVRFLRGLAAFVEKAKEERVSPHALREWAARRLQSTDNAEVEEGELYQELADCYETITQIFHEHHVLTYADLLTKTLELLETSPLALKEEQERCRYLLIDEFQDTNTVQAAIAYALAGEQANLFVVGDDDQSIYRFRGANITNILDFRNRYPQAPLITLTENFRSTQNILDAAYNLIIHNNPHRLEAQAGVDKRLQSQRGAGPEVACHRYETGHHEAECVADTIKDLITNHGHEPGDIAILARSHNHLDLFEQELMNLGVPVRRAKEGSFYEQPGVEAALSFLRFLVNPSLNANLFYLLQGVPFCVPVDELRELNVTARRLSLSLWEQLNAAETLAPELAEARIYLNDRLTHLSGSRPSEALRRHIQESSWGKTLLDDSQQLVASHLNTLYHEARSFETLNRPGTLAQYLQYVDDIRESGEDPLVENETVEQTDGVALLTVHASKGLEFRTVFVVNLVSKRFPGSDRVDQLRLPAELLNAPTDNVKYEEERRLAYVALTRAKEQLYLTGARRYGSNKTASKPSVFIQEALNVSEEPACIHHQLRGGLSKRSEAAHLSQRLPFPNLFTASALEAFEDNPASYERQHLYSILNDPHDNGATAFGTAVHAVLRAAFTARKDGVPFDLEENLQRHWTGEGYENAIQREEAYATALTVLRKHLEDLPANFVPEAVEVPVELRLENGLRIIGKIDRLDRHEDGTLTIVDYKTGRSKNPAKPKDNLPLAIYALALTQRGETVRDICLDYLLLDQRPCAAITPAFLESAQQRVNDLIELLRAAYLSGEFPEKKRF